MAGEIKAITKALTARMVARAIASFDRSITVVVAVSWGAAIIMLFISLYTLSLTSSGKRAMIEAMAAEPILPQVVRTPITNDELVALVDKLKKRFPDIKIELLPGTGIYVRSTDGTQFRQWMVALSYIDIMAPQFNWTLKDMCVGNSCSPDLMRATLSGEKVTFSAPVQ